MECQELAARIKKLQPQAESSDVARMCLLVQNIVKNLDELQDESRLDATCRDIGLRLQHACDQHAAMTEELEALAESDPKQFKPDDIWVLIRAIKVQNQMLQLYASHHAIDV